MVLLIRVGVHNPVVTKSLVAGNMEKNDTTELEDMQMWRDVMVPPCTLLCYLQQCCHQGLSAIYMASVLFSLMVQEPQLR